MAEINIFRYFPQKSPIHQLHTRFKFIVLFFFSLSCLNTNILGLSVLSLALVLVFFMAKLPLRALWQDFRYFLLFIPIIVVVPALKTEITGSGNSSWLSIDNEGLQYGIYYAYRLLLFFAIGTILIGTTTISSITSTVEWLLTPIPFIPQVRVAFMISLTINFIPLIAEQVQEIQYAQKSRGIGRQKNPIKRIRYLLYPLMTKMLARIDEIAFAMENRCYNEERTKQVTPIYLSDWYMLLGASCVCMSVLYFF